MDRYDDIYEYDNFDDEGAMDWFTLDNEDWGKDLIESMSID